MLLLADRMQSWYLDVLHQDYYGYIDIIKCPAAFLTLPREFPYRIRKPRDDDLIPELQRMPGRSHSAFSPLGEENTRISVWMKDHAFPFLSDAHD